MKWTDRHFFLLSSPVSYLKHREARGRCVSLCDFLLQPLLPLALCCMSSLPLPSSTMDPHHQHDSIPLNYNYCLPLSSPPPIVHYKLRLDPNTVAIWIVNEVWAASPYFWRTSLMEHEESTNITHHFGTGTTCHCFLFNGFTIFCCSFRVCF